MAARTNDSRSDADLIEYTRAGDSTAYGELWQRHAPSAMVVAASVTGTFDPDDVVAEAFTRILKVIREGGGPTGAFRPYLFTTVRNTAYSWGRQNRETPIEDADSIEDYRFSEENSLAALDRSLTVQAFRTLPTRWQEVLWYSEVEQMTPLQIGPLLAMKANAVAALTYRAREGLRGAWIQAHISSVPEGSEHRWVLEHVGGYARKRLSKRDTSRMDAHLEHCAKCLIVVEEAGEVNSRLPLVLLPLVAGIGGAAAYSAYLQHGASAGVYALGVNGAASMPASVTAGHSVGVVGGAGAAGGGLSAGAVVAALVTGALVVAGAAVAATLNHEPTARHAAAGRSAVHARRPPTASSSSTSTAGTSRVPLSPEPSVPAAETTATPTPSSPRRATTTTPSPQVAPSPPAAPGAPAVTSPSDSILNTDAASLLFTGTGVPGDSIELTAVNLTDPDVVARTTVESTGSWSVQVPLGGLSSGAWAIEATQTGPGGTSAATTRRVIIDRSVPAPVITTVDTGTEALYYPIVSGTGVAGDRVELSDADGPPASVTVSSAGTWSSPQLTGFAAGSDQTITVTQTDSAGNTSPAAISGDFALAASPAAVSSVVGRGMNLTVTGVPGANVEVLTGSGTRPGWFLTLDDSGVWTGWCWWVMPVADSSPLALRYSDGTRFGPSASLSVGEPG